MKNILEVINYAKQHMGFNVGVYPICFKIVGYAICNSMGTNKPFVILESEYTFIDEIHNVSLAKIFIKNTNKHYYAWSITDVKRLINYNNQ